MLIRTIIEFINILQNFKCQIVLELLKMYRVLFRVIKICVHIKENLELQISLKKDNQIIVGKNLYSLSNGIAQVDLSTQFLIKRADPSFQVHINFTFKKHKKLAGYVLLNLHDWICGNSYEEIRTLQKAPGGKAIIQFGFTYFQTDIKQMEKSLIVLQEFQNESNKQFRGVIEQQNFCLEQKLKILSYERKQLTDIKQNYHKFDHQREVIETGYNNIISSHQLKMTESQFELKEEQDKTNFLMALINNSGSQDLIESLNGLDKMDVQSSQNKEKDN